MLLLGEAGAGKTTAMYKLAYDWAVGKWGQGVRYLYMIAVNRLQESRYLAPSASYIAETLGTAIALECFPGLRAESKFRRVRWVIEQTLSDPSTLVILDGLDERSGCSRLILQEAMGGPHKLLLTSRPYGIQSERRDVDLVVDHKGLSP